jgi:hypothetical protein
MTVTASVVDTLRGQAPEAGLVFTEETERALAAMTQLDNLRQAYLDGDISAVLGTASWFLVRQRQGEQRDPTSLATARMLRGWALIRLARQSTSAEEFWDLLDDAINDLEIANAHAFSGPGLRLEAVITQAQLAYAYYLGDQLAEGHATITWLARQIEAAGRPDIFISIYNQTIEAINDLIQRHQREIQQS